MRRLVIAAALAFAAPASASTVTYQVYGSEFTTCEDTEGGAACAGYVGEWIGRSFDGAITLDLDVLGLPHLGNKTVSATVLSDGTGAEGILVDLNFIGPRFHAPTGGAEFNFTTDARGNGAGSQASNRRVVVQCSRQEAPGAASATRSR
jgi:hypothetical protein